MNIFNSSTGDSKFFTTTKKGEVFEIKADLNGDDKDKKKQAVKKVIASMTVGKDVSALFPDVLKNMQTEDMELKKLVYLYLMNYAKTQPELAILAVNTFVKDCDDSNPLLRALAIRTMGCIRVDKIIDYLSQPLGKCLKDPDPYVRKTAVLVVAKFFDINPTLCEQNGFFDDLRGMLSDSNSMVVANTIAALTEIMEEVPSSRVLEWSTSLLNKLLTALNECFEWGQIFILEALSKYTPVDSQEAQSIAERVLPRLGHGNASVVLSAVKVLLKLAERITDQDFVRQLYKKLAPPLVSQLSNESEVQYIALRNIGLILRKYPDILSQELRVFFCKYNDPPYVKREKLEIIIRLANERNIEVVLTELQEYATEVDVEFVRSSIRAIGRCALTISKATERCIASLLDLIRTKVNYVLQECIVVIKDIFRKYPKRYESLIPTLCENLDTLDDPEAKASMIWIIGEYGERITNAEELLNIFVESFQDDPTPVQMQMLTAAVKLFLKKPKNTSELVQKVLQLATTGASNPDLRDRGYIYWRLLSTDPNAAKAIVLAERPPITGEIEEDISGSLLDELIANLTTVASVYYKPAAALLKHAKLTPQSVVKKQRRPEDAEDGDSGPEDGTNSDNAVPTPTSSATPPLTAANGSAGPTAAAGTSAQNLMDDLLDLDLLPAVTAPRTLPKSEGSLLDLLDDVGTPASAPPSNGPQQQRAKSGMDILGELLGGGGGGGGAATPMGGTTSTPPGVVAGFQTLLTAQQGQGMEVSGRFARRNGGVFLDMRFANHSVQPISGFAIQFNSNTFKLAPGGPIPLPGVHPNSSQDTTIPIAFTGTQAVTDPVNLLQIAFKNNVSVFYGQTKFPVQVLCSEDGRMEPSQYPSTWTQIAEEKQGTFGNLQLGSVESVVEKLQRNNVFVVVQRKNPQNMDTLYLSAKLMDVPVLCETIVHPNMSSIKMACKSANPLLAAAFLAAVEGILRG